MPGPEVVTVKNMLVAGEVRRFIFSSVPFFHHLIALSVIRDGRISIRLG
jgi:hypothetical protein